MYPKVVAFIFGVAASVAVDSCASIIVFTSLESASPNGEWRVGARFHGVTEWANTEKTGPLNGTLRYEMRTANGKSVWISDTPIDDEFSSFETPTAIFVSDQAWTAVRTHDSMLLCFSPSGKRTAHIDILKTLIPELFYNRDGDLFISGTAGRMWGQWYAYHYFITSMGENYFVIRTHWDDRLVVRLRDGDVIVPNRGLAVDLAAAEKTFVTRTLETAIRTPKLSNAPKDVIRSVITAAHIAGRSKLKEAIPLLRKLEPMDYSPREYFGSSFSLDQARRGAIDPACGYDLTPRQVIHLSLRRLGEKPRVFPCVHLVMSDSDPPTWATLPEPESPRENGVESLQPGLTPEAVVRLVGSPDFVSGWSDGAKWEYDMDTKRPYTLEITWGDDGVVKTFAEIRPPLWQQKQKRDLQILAQW